jgi:hypothetical protein
MSKVYCSAVVPAPVQDVWALVRDFGSFAERHPMVADSWIEGDRSGDTVGCVRTFPLPDGGHQRDQLLALSDLDHSCAFTIIEGPVPLENYLSELRLRRVTADETTFVEWVGQFDVADADEAEVCNTVMTVYHAGLEALRARFTAG